MNAPCMNPSYCSPYVPDRKGEELEADLRDGGSNVYFLTVVILDRLQTHGQGWYTFQSLLAPKKNH